MKIDFYRMVDIVLRLAVDINIISPIHRIPLITFIIVTHIMDIHLIILHIRTYIKTMKASMTRQIHELLAV